MKRLTTFANNQRTSTQDLLQQIYTALAEGETEFEIDGSGQQDIGGPLWNRQGQPLKFVVRNPGQRVGSHGHAGDRDRSSKAPAPADVGWLNAGATIVVKGDGGRHHRLRGRGWDDLYRRAGRDPFRLHDETRPGLPAAPIVGAQEHRLLLVRIHGRRDRRGMRTRLRESGVGHRRTCLRRHGGRHGLRARPGGQTAGQRPAGRDSWEKRTGTFSWTECPNS